MRLWYRAFCCSNKGIAHVCHVLRCDKGIAWGCHVFFSQSFIMVSRAFRKSDVIHFHAFIIFSYILVPKSVLFGTAYLSFFIRFLTLITGSTTGSISGWVVRRVISLRRYGIRIDTVLFSIMSFFFFSSRELSL